MAVDTSREAVRPTFLETLQSFASMCERSLSIEDGPMLAAKFKDAAAVISIQQHELASLLSERDALRAAKEKAEADAAFANSGVNALVDQKIELMKERDQLRAELAAAKERLAEAEKVSRDILLVDFDIFTEHDELLLDTVLATARAYADKYKEKV